MGIYTNAWSPNFQPSHIACDFMPFLIEIPTLPMEYRDLKIIELIANKIGVFIWHDLVPFDEPSLSIRFCTLLNLNKPLPSSLIMSSKYAYWNQTIIIQDARTMVKMAGWLGHFTNQCQDPSYSNLIVCSNHNSNLLKCTFRTLHSFCP